MVVILIRSIRERACFFVASIMENAEAEPAATLSLRACSTSLGEVSMPARKPATMESPAPTELTSFPFGALARKISPAVVSSTAPKRPMDTRTFCAPCSRSCCAWFFTVSRQGYPFSRIADFPQISASSLRLGLMRNGLYFSTLERSPWLVSTTIRQPLGEILPMISSYTLPGIEGGILPESTSVSSELSLSSLVKSWL